MGSCLKTEQKIKTPNETYTSTSNLINKIKKYKILNNKKYFKKPIKSHKYKTTYKHNNTCKQNNTYPNLRTTKFSK